MKNLYALQIKDGRYVQCYYWTSRRADFGTNIATAWRGTLDEADKLQREWSWCDRPKEVTFTLSRYIVYGSFTDVIISLHTYAANEDDALARFHLAFTKEQIAVVLAGARPSITCVDDDAHKHMAKFWKHHGYAFYG